MSRKNKEKQKFIYEKDLDNYYDLKSDAVDALVNASEDTAPEVGKAELKEYHKSVLNRIPMWVKALFIKFWFNGAVCFFFLWGLGTIIQNWWDQVLIVGLALGVVTDLLVNNVFRFMAQEPHDNDKWMMIPQKKFWTLFVNIFYAGIVFSIEILVYHGINLLILAGNPDVEYNFGNFLGVEPFLFGIFYLIIDMAFISMKNLFVKIVRDAKAKTQAQMEEKNAENGASDSNSDANSAENSAEKTQQITVVHQITPSGKKSKKKKK